MSQHQFYISWCLLLLLALLASCDHQLEPLFVADPMPDSIRIGYGAHWITIPCRDTDGVTAGSPIVPYIQFSTRLRLDTVWVDPREQIIPLAIGNGWHYRAHVYPGADTFGMYRRHPQPSTVDNSLHDLMLHHLALFVPDTLVDTLTLPTVMTWQWIPARHHTGTIDNSTTVRRTVTGNSREVATPMERYCGVRRWYLSTATHPDLHPDGRNRYYVYSSDPQGVLVGVRTVSPLDAVSRVARDTVKVLKLLTNTLTSFIGCGEEQNGNRVATITTPAGIFNTYFWHTGRYDTTYYAVGAGMVRARARARLGSGEDRASGISSNTRWYYLVLEHVTLQHRGK
jgi:hypothetical protein